VARSALGYARRKAAQDAPVIDRMKVPAAHYGYRRIRIFLGRDGHRMSVGRAYRLWQAAGLQVPAQTAVQARGSGPSAATGAIGPNRVRSYDLVFDRCANGQQLKCLTVTDEFTKEGWRSTWTVVSARHA
jgi:putative transposase